MGDVRFWIYRHWLHVSAARLLVSISGRPVRNIAGNLLWRIFVLLALGSLAEDYPQDSGAS